LPNEFWWPVPRPGGFSQPRYSDGEISHLDGVSVDYDTWHFNVRPSNTEPLLRLNLGASNEQEMEERTEELLRVIRS